MPDWSGRMSADGKLWGVYYLLGMKQSAWVTTTGQYSTDITQAKAFERDEALAQAKRHKTAGNILVPVRQEDMEAT